ncbi:MAG: 30S ribosomal protein S3 [Cohaesibacteraceae bacterium]
MGQKVIPTGLRLGINQTWNSRWFADTDYAKLLHEDLKIRNFIKDELPGFVKKDGDRNRGGADPAISKIVIERPLKKCRISIHTARPGFIIGPKGDNIEKLRRAITKMTDSEVHLNIVEVRKPDTDATLVAQSIASQLERRVAFRRAMKRAVQNAMKAGALGIRINSGGRLGGAEIARTEWYREGQVPLHTLRADVDYGTAEAKTAYGIIGIKVWIYKGEIMEHDPLASERRALEASGGGGGGGGRRRDG